MSIGVGSSTVPRSSVEPPRILLTGVTGQVGWELRRTLAPLGRVISADRNALDLTNPDSIRTLVHETKPHIIVNPAAYTAVDQAEKEPELAFAINAKAPAVMAEEALRLGALLVHYSTDYVFDGTKAQPYVEEDAPNPLGVYGKSKLASEQAIRDSGCRYLIFRTSWVYGMRGKNFLLTMLRLANERESLRIVDDQVGAPTWSRMIAEATAVAIGQLIADPRRAEAVSGVFHLTAAGATSWYGFAQEIFRLGGERGLCRTPMLEPIPSEQYPVPAARPKNSRLNNEKLFRTFGLMLPAWDEGLAMCIDEAR